MNSFTFPQEEQHFRIQNCKNPQMLADQLANLMGAVPFTCWCMIYT